MADSESLTDVKVLNVETSFSNLSLEDQRSSKSFDIDVIEDAEESEVVLFHLNESYVYKIPPRKTAASYRADEWNINKWAWEGAISVVSRGDDCTIRLADATTAELFAQAPVRPDQPLPVEAVIDSSRFFVLRIEDSSPAPPPAAGKIPAAAAASSAAASVRHAFIGLGFRERPQAYDFQAAVYDHVKYVNKKKEAREMGQEYEAKPASDLRLKPGQNLRLDIKTPSHKFKSCQLPVSPTTPGNVAFSKGLNPPMEGPSPMRQASGDHAETEEGESSGERASASRSSSSSSCGNAIVSDGSSSDSSPGGSPSAALPPVLSASPPILLPPPPPARLSSPPTQTMPVSGTSSTIGFAWAFQSPPASPTSASAALAAGNSGVAGCGEGSAAAADGADNVDAVDADDFGDFVAA